jgi:hypothetical protein
MIEITLDKLVVWAMTMVLVIASYSADDHQCFHTPTKMHEASLFMMMAVTTT